MHKPPRLTPKSLQVLQLIAAGRSYEQIVDAGLGLTYFDVFFAAEEALWQNEKRSKPEAPETSEAEGVVELNAIEKSKLKHPRAYAPWSREEDAELKALHAAGVSRSKIADKLQRQSSAIRSRLTKLGL